MSPEQQATARWWKPLPWRWWRQVDSETMSAFKRLLIVNFFLPCAVLMAIALLSRFVMDKPARPSAADIAIAFLDLLAAVWLIVSLARAILRMRKIDRDIRRQLAEQANRDV